MSDLSRVALPSFELRTSMRALRRYVLARFQNPAPVRDNHEPEFELIEHLGADRASVEIFISQRFAESFGCRVEAFMPRLFSVRDRDGTICGAFGLRSAHSRLFLEQYLDAPIEQAISARTGLAIERRMVVEVGHFSGMFPGAVRAMIALLTERLHRDGTEWVAFTGTAGLRNAFYRLGLTPIDLHPARAECLPLPARAAWGSYYDHGPRVLIGSVREGMGAMQEPIAADVFACGDSA